VRNVPHGSPSGVDHDGRNKLAREHGAWTEHTADVDDQRKGHELIDDQLGRWSGDQDLVRSSYSAG